MKMPLRIALTVTLALIAILDFASSAGAFALDHKFGQAGLAGFEVQAGDPEGESSDSVAMQSDGRILVAMNVISPHEFGGNVIPIARLRVDGSLDPDYGTDGISLVKFPEVSQASRPLIALRHDGSLVVVARGTNGRDHDSTGRRKNAGVLIAVLNRRGRLDRSFSRDGTKLLRRSKSPGGLLEIETLARNRLLLTTSKTINGRLHVFFTRLNSHGAYETSFGRRGVKRVRFGIESRRWAVRGVATYRKRSMLLVEMPSRSFGRTRCSVVSLWNVGRRHLDSTFGSGGVAVLPVGSEAEDSLCNTIEVTSHGIAAVIEQSAGASSFLSRLTLSGESATLVGGSGVAPIAITATELVAIGRDRWLVAGHTGPGDLFLPYTVATVSVLDGHGSPDPGFEIGGSVGLADHATVSAVSSMGGDAVVAITRSESFVSHAYFARFSN